jgi:hypothetical protein
LWVRRSCSKFLVPLRRNHSAGVWLQGGSVQVWLSASSTPPCVEPSRTDKPGGSSILGIEGVHAAGKGNARVFASSDDRHAMHFIIYFTGCFFFHRCVLITHATISVATDSEHGRHYEFQGSYGLSLPRIWVF